MKSQARNLQTFQSGARLLSPTSSKDTELYKQLSVTSDLKKQQTRYPLN